jgi:hypothetical protein
MLPLANDVTRETVPASHITVGLQCGGSDGYSGITANPALGAAVDLLVRHGGTAILSETPEIYGAEHLLTRRAVSRAIGDKLVARIRWWEDYTARERGEMNNNPSPGNKAGGLTTILEKSLGAVAKGGTTNLVEVYEYAEPVTAKGFVYMDTPGYDPVSATGQVAGGANMIVFTTGRGSAYRCDGVAERDEEMRGDRKIGSQEESHEVRHEVHGRVARARACGARDRAGEDRRLVGEGLLSIRGRGAVRSDQEIRGEDRRQGRSVAIRRAGRHPENRRSARRGQSARRRLHRRL